MVEETLEVHEPRLIGLQTTEATTAVSVGPALPVLKYISTFRSGDARGAAAGWAVRR